MAVKWIKAAPGIRCWEHQTRKNGVRPDRYFTIRHHVDGKLVEEGLGWATEGWSLKRAQEELGKLRAAKRTGEGAISLSEKRKKADTARKFLAEQARLQKIVADLWDRYSKEVAAIDNKPRTVAEKTRMWERRIKPALGAIKINDVTEEDVGAVVRSPLRVDDKGQVVGGKAEAGNVYRLLHHMFAKALAWNLRSKALGNPLESVLEPKVARRERLLTAGEVGTLLKALDKAELEKTEDKSVVIAIKAAFLTGARIGELLSLRWENIRRQEMELHLSDTKTGFSRRPLSLDALALFDSAEKMVGVPYVFRAVDNPTACLSYHTVEKAFRRVVKAAEIKRCTLHTIRHWFATLTANAVSNPRIGMALTGHKSHVAYMNYVHGDRQQAQALADQLAALAKKLGESPDNAVVFGRKDAKPL